MEEQEILNIIQPVYKVYDTQTKILTIFLWDDVNEINCNQVVIFINEAEQDPNVCSIVLNICSYGGFIIDGYKVVDTIRNSNKPIICHNAGFCFSIAGVIWLSGDIRTANDFSVMMIHNPSINGEDVDDSLIVIKESLKKILGTEFKPETLDELMDAETYFLPEQLQALGIDVQVINTNSDLNILSELKSSPKNPQNVKNIYNMVNKYEPDAKINIDEMKETKSNFYTNLLNTFKTKAKNADETKEEEKVADEPTNDVAPEQEPDGDEEEKQTLKDLFTMLDQRISKMEDFLNKSSIEAEKVKTENSKKEMIRNAGIEITGNLLKLDTQTLKDVLKDIKPASKNYSNTAPKVEGIVFENSTKDAITGEYDLNKMTQAERKALANAEPKKFAQLFLKQKPK